MEVDKDSVEIDRVRLLVCASLRKLLLAYVSRIFGPKALKARKGSVFLCSLATISPQKHGFFPFLKATSSTTPPKPPLADRSLRRPVSTRNFPMSLPWEIAPPCQPPSELACETGRWAFWVQIWWFFLGVWAFVRAEFVLKRNKRWVWVRPYMYWSWDLDGLLWCFDESNLLLDHWRLCLCSLTSLGWSWCAARRRTWGLELVELKVRKDEPMMIQKLQNSGSFGV